MEENEIGTVLLDIAFEVHRELGPGLLEPVYEVVLAHELRKRGVSTARQVPIRIAYKGLIFEEGFRADIIAGDKVIVEVKCVDRLHYAHRKQVLTYLRLTNMPLGYVLNFSAAILRDGVIRVVNGSDNLSASDNRQSNPHLRADHGFSSAKQR